MVESIQSASSGIQAAVALMDDASRHAQTPPLPPVGASHPERDNGTGDEQAPDNNAVGPDGTLVRTGPTMDLHGTPTGEWPPGSVFAPGFLHADRRGLVAWPGFDAQVTRILAKRSVSANAEVMRQAQETYASITRLVS